MGNYKTNGLFKHPLFKVWAGIISRCYTPSSSGYKQYGLKGVKVCDLWRHNFLEFYNWAISNGWEKGLQIDKDIIPKKLGIPALLYSPELCSIVTKKQNCNLRASSRFIEYKGETKTVSQWAEEYGLNKTTLKDRLNSGWDVEKCFTEKAYRRKKIKCDTTGEIFESVTDAAKTKNVQASYISGVLKGFHKSTKGLKFSYLN